MRSADRLTLTFSALADPTRRKIVEKLAKGEATVNTLAKPLKMSLPGVSKHLKVLQRAGLVVQGRDAQRRPCRLNAKRLQDVANWAERFRGNWEESFVDWTITFPKSLNRRNPNDRKRTA